MPDATTATFVITTARSGTQWLANMLRDGFPDQLHVEHEPVGYRYRPAANLRDPAAVHGLTDDPVIAAHFRMIEDTLREGRSYVEVGFPAFALHPLLSERFGDRLRIVQLVRHPVRVAASLVTQRWYTEDGRGDVRATVALTPWSCGVLLRDYADRWQSMTAFEKGLFYWYEVHAYGREVARKGTTDDVTLVRFMDLVSDASARSRLLAFLGLSGRGEFPGNPGERVDRFRNSTSEPIDVSLVERHPVIVALAEELGYDMNAVAQQEIDDRHRERAVDRWNRRLGRIRRRLRRPGR
jgi:hypothetical protein